MGSISPGGSINYGNMGAPPSGYTRVAPSYCRANRPGRITVDIANADFTTAAITSINFLDGVVTLDGVVAANSGLMFPATATMLVMSFQLTVKSAGILNQVDYATIHGIDTDGVSIFESAPFQMQEQAAMAAGLTLGILTPIIHIPVYESSKIRRSVAFLGTGSAVTAVRLLGYYD